MANPAVRCDGKISRAYLGFNVVLSSKAIKHMTKCPDFVIILKDVLLKQGLMTCQTLMRFRGPAGCVRIELVKSQSPDYHLILLNHIVSNPKEMIYASKEVVGVCILLPLFYMSSNMLVQFHISALHRDTDSFLFLNHRGILKCI